MTVALRILFKYMQILFPRKLIYFEIYDIQIYILIKCIFKKETLYQKRKFTLGSNFSLKLDDIFKKKVTHVVRARIE